MPTTLKTIMSFLAVSGSVLAAPPNISPLTKRFELRCDDNGGGYQPVGEAQRCVDLLMKKGTDLCTVHGQNTVFCRDGNTVINGANISAKGSASSYCRDVASSAQKIIDRCTRPDGRVAGVNAATGNGELIVSINRAEVTH